MAANDRLAIDDFYGRHQIRIDTFIDDRVHAGRRIEGKMTNVQKVTVIETYQFLKNFLNYNYFKKL